MFTRNRAEAERGKSRSGASGGPLMRAGRAGSSHADWIFEAIQELKDEEGVDRVGVWLEEPGGAETSEAQPAVFRGEVWDEGIASGVAGWTRLACDAPLPMHMLSSGMSCEYEIEGTMSEPIVGALVGLSSVLWVPVLERRILRGLVMAGTRRKQMAMPRLKAERVAEKLGLLLELEEERRIAAGRKADLEFWQRMERLLSEEQNANRILGQLVESCTRGNQLGGAGAVFALIGERKSGQAGAVPSHACCEEQLVIRAQSGDAAWAHGLQDGPLETLWRQAIENRRVSGETAKRLPLAKDIARIVAIPLEVGEKMEGALLAGLPRKRATLEVLARLELRALLAARALENERRAEALKQKQLWQTALLECSREPVVLMDRQARIVGRSGGAREMAIPGGEDLGAASESQLFAELFPDGHRQDVQKWLESEVAELECELKGGSRVKLKRLTLSGQELTAVGLRRIEKDEAQFTGDSQEALKQALEWLEEGVVVYGEAGEILACNTRFLQIFGLQENGRKQLRTLEDLIEGVAKNAVEPQAFAAEWRRLGENCTDGTREELEMTKPALQKIERCARPIVGRNGEKVGRVEVYREMTARRVFESRMVQAEKLASLGQRVTGVIHELSNPLTTILGNAQRMVAQEEENRHSAEARQILREAERAADIVRQLLHLSRETRPETQLVSLNELVEKTVELQKGGLAEGRLRLCVETAKELPRVNGDFAKLQQALLNLLQNAQQAVQESGKGGTIGVRTFCAELGRVRMEVWDDGPGVPEALQARIFEPFFTTKPAGKGTGLGLAIVNNFVREHGGTISVHSLPQGGAKFVVELPAAGEARGQLPDRRKMAHGRAEGLPACYRQGEIVLPGIPEKTPRILVVEDEPTVASLIADVLKDEGMQVDVFPDGKKALEAARHESYDLAICDLKMPGMDGQILYGALVENHLSLQEHVLFVTGDVIAQRIREFLEAHHLPHVAKPFRVEELCLAVRKMLWGQPASGEAVARVGKDGQLGNWMNP